MIVDHCEREAAVLEALQAGRWPDACDKELRAHVAQCALCAEVVLVAKVLRQEDATALAQAHLPAPGLVWWKAQIRARRAAAERAAAPITMVERLAAACVVLSLLGLAIWQWDRVESGWNWFRVLPFKGRLWPAGASNLWTPNLAFVLTMFLCLALASFVLYLVFAKD
jgi:hypothetical protein